ncbi:MAG: hypothetical protein U5J64_02450 [Halobacteriales archaeon]|nr:hypothetical protein [Halobacteriales archaeon]
MGCCSEMGENGNEGRLGRLSGGHMSDTGVFDDIDALKPSYTPRELPHRRQQVDETASVLVSALRGDTPSNVLMYGRKGTGKTATARYVGGELESAGRGLGASCEFGYLDCDEFDTQYRVLAQLARGFGREDVPTTGWA